MGPNTRLWLSHLPKICTKSNLLIYMVGISLFSENQKKNPPICLQKSRERLSFILKLFGLFLGSLLVLRKFKNYLEVVVFLGFEVVIYSLRKNPNRKAINRFGLIFLFPANYGIPSLSICLLYSYETHKNRPCILLKLW